MTNIDSKTIVSCYWVYKPSAVLQNKALKGLGV
jgi:hypothetical protein